MAIFYEHIKGCAGNNAYSWITWQDNDRPTVKTNTESTKTDARDWGTIVTTQGSLQTINTPIQFYDYISFKDLFQVTCSDTIFELESLNTDASIKVTLNSDSILTIDQDKIQLTKTLNSTQGFNFNGDGSLKKLTTTDNVSVGKDLTVSKDLTVTGKCQAEYFNAASDARAKENIETANFSALELIDDVEIKTFNYLNDKEPTLGMIAQELIDSPAGEMQLVNNLDATGVDGDFMTIKESKLVYVLWKAIQEQQEEIELLGKEIRDLRKQINK